MKTLSLKQSPPRQRTRAIADDLADASWAQADEALAMAWRDATQLEETLDAIQRSRSLKTAAPAAIKKLNAAAAEALLLRQSLNRAARLRGLRPLGAKGEIVRHDPARQEAVGGRIVRGARVQIVRPGAERQVGERMVVLTRAVVRITRARK